MKRFSILRFLFGLALAAGIALLWTKIASARNVNTIATPDGLLIGGGVVVLFSFEFLHTMMGHSASAQGSPFNMFVKIKGNIDWSNRDPDRVFTPEYMTAGLLSAAVGAGMLLFG